MGPGRPNLDIAERLRRRVWYWYVANNSGMKEYAMDVKFDIFPMSAPNKKNPGNRRRKIFQPLRDHDIMPFKGHLEEFLNKVDQHEHLKGSRDLYCASFWRLVSDERMDINQTHEFVLQCIRNTGLLVESGSNEILDELEPLYKDDGFTVSAALNLYPALVNLNNYETSLKDTLSRIQDDLEKLALVGGLLREAWFAGQLRCAFIIEKYFSKTLRKVAAGLNAPDEVKKLFWMVADQRVLQPASLKSGIATKSYFQMLEAQENPMSKVGELLLRHEACIWARNHLTPVFVDSENTLLL